MDTLPEDCIVCILSSVTPRDTCHFLATSSWARAGAESDALWEKFLPSDYDEILCRLVSPILFKSKKELFFRLLSPLHVDGGNKEIKEFLAPFLTEYNLVLNPDAVGKIFESPKESPSFLRFTGKKCYMLSARELSITWGSNPISWSWKPLLQSRFSEVVELITTWWLEIVGKIHSRMLSPNTAYKAYLIVKFSKRAYGLDTLPSEVTVKLGHDQESYNTVYLRPGVRKPLWEHLGLVIRKGSSRPNDYVGKDNVIHERIDGWFEIKLGEFYNYGNDEVVKMSLKETDGVHLKGGLIVEGIEVRPK